MVEVTYLEEKFGSLSQSFYTPFLPKWTTSHPDALNPNANLYENPKLCIMHLYV